MEKHNICKYSTQGIHLLEIINTTAGLAITANHTMTGKTT